MREDTDTVSDIEEKDRRTREDRDARTYQLVVQAHADCAEAGAARPCAEERITPSITRLRVGLDEREGPPDRLDTLNREVRDDGVGFDGPKCLDGVGYGVQAGRDLHRGL